MSGLIARHLEAASLDLMFLPPRRGNIGVGRALAGKDRLLLKVRTDREGSMTVTRVEFRGEDEWYCILRIVDGSLSVSSACSGYFLRKAGAGDIARFLESAARKVKGKNFKRRLMHIWDIQGGDGADGIPE